MVEDCKACGGTGEEWIANPIGGTKVPCEACGGRGY